MSAPVSTNTSGSDAALRAAAPDASARRRPPTGSGNRRRIGAIVVRTLIVAVIGLATVAPLYWMIVVALSSRSELLSGGEVRLWPRELTFENFGRVFSSFPVATWFGNSFAIALTTTVITVTTSLLAGYAFAQLRFPGSTALFFVGLATLVLPVQVIMVSLFRIVVGAGLYGTYWGVILPTAASAFGLFLARQFMVGIPRELIEASRLDGASHLQTFVRVVLPLSRPLIAVLAFMSLLASWNDFAWPLIALKENRLFTLPIGLLFLQGQFNNDYGATMAFALLNVVPIALLFLLFQRFFIAGFARSGIK